MVVMNERNVIHKSEVQPAKQISIGATTTSTASMNRSRYVIPALRDQSSTKTVFLSPGLPQMLEEDYCALLVALGRSGSGGFSSAKAETILTRLDEETRTLKKLEWSLRLDELIQVLKDCLNFTNIFKNEPSNIEGRLLAYDPKEVTLGQSRHGIMKLKGVLSDDALKEEQLNAGRPIIRKSYSVLWNLLNVLSPQHGYNFFESLMKKAEKNDQDFMSFFQNPSLREAIHAIIDLRDLLDLLLSSLRKAKCTFNLGEAKAVAYQNVPHTSFSASASRRLDEFCVFLMDTVESPVENLHPDDVYDGLVTAAGLVPFIRLDENVFRRLLLLIYNSFHKGEGRDSNSSRIPESVLLQLMGSVLTVNWDMDELVPKLSLIQFQQFSIDFCNDILSRFILDVDMGTLEQENAGKEIKKAQHAIRVLISFCDNYFQDFIPMSLNCVGLVSEMLTIGKKLEDSLWTSKRGRRVPPDLQLIQGSYTALMVEGLEFIKTITRSLGKFLQEASTDKDFTDAFIGAWYNLFSQPTVLETNNIDILSAVVNCFASVKEELFEYFNYNQRVFCIVSALGYAKHSSAAIRSRGARCLAIYLELRSLVQHNVQFILDCLETIDLYSIPDQCDFTSRMNFSWAASNLCDALAKYHVNSDDPSLGWNIYYQIYELVIRLINDNVKMRHNANRALGALVIWTPLHFLEEAALRPCIRTVSAVLSKQLGAGRDFKARWNATHALGNIIRNEELWKKFNPDIADIVFPAFIRVLRHGENFKERYHATKGLLAVHNRAEYGTYFRETWVVTMEAFKASPESKVPIPHGVFEKYLDEVALAIMHLASLTEPNEDLGPSGELESVFLDNYETLVDSSELVLSRSEENAHEWLTLAVANISKILALI